jgi:DNA-binding NarL/FixJ family response regulator
MNANNQIKIFLVGDYSIFRVALRMLIETESHLKVIGEASTLKEAFGQFTKEKPDVILVDLPETDGANLFSFLLNSIDKTPILVLTGSNDVELYVKCLQLSVKGLVLKQKSADVLFKAIEKVHAGEYWLERSIMGQTIKRLMEERNFHYENNHHAEPNQLTEREKQVVSLICKGLKNKNIAEKLFITETTVRHHLTSIFEKLGTKSRLELVIYAFKNNIEKVPVRNDLAADGTRLNGNLPLHAM